MDHKNKQKQLKCFVATQYFINSPNHKRRSFHSGTASDNLRGSLKASPAIGTVTASLIIPHQGVTEGS